MKTLDNSTEHELGTSLDSGRLPSSDPKLSIKFEGRLYLGGLLSFCSVVPLILLGCSIKS